MLKWWNKGMEWWSNGKGWGKLRGSEVEKRRCSAIRKNINQIDKKQHYDLVIGLRSNIFYIFGNRNTIF